MKRSSASGSLLTSGWYCPASLPVGAPDLVGARTAGDAERLVVVAEPTASAAVARGTRDRTWAGRRTRSPIAYPERATPRSCRSGDPRRARPRPPRAARGRTARRPRRCGVTPCRSRIASDLVEERAQPVRRARVVGLAARARARRCRRPRASSRSSSSACSSPAARARARNACGSCRDRPRAQVAVLGARARREPARVGSSLGRAGSPGGGPRGSDARSSAAQLRVNSASMTSSSSPLAGARRRAPFAVAARAAGARPTPAGRG